MRKGVTLLEVLVSLFIMAIGILAVLSLFPVGVFGMKRAVDNAPVATIEAVDLWTAYKENAITADQKYKWKLIKVTGRLASFDFESGEDGHYKTGFETITIGERSYFGVVCIIDEGGSAEFEMVDRNKPVALAGVCKGMQKAINPRLGYIVTLEKCRLAR